ncbi:hypothetical protein I553_6309 [Mycobacterium xenopi 4042]|uniref:Uncharacterized protein n=1 Tax=Mycobacterium xenopi 4042 TaxID=1299334 RepID=X8BF11_MYCXE|nr:hypothetical protein I553_6309 [Mycobacterium xenopi 4042]
MSLPIPARHPDQPRPVPAGIQLAAMVLGIDKPTPKQWRRLGEQLTVGDEPMDRLVEWMASAGMEHTRPLFDRALAEGIANVPEAPDPLREFFVRVEATPDWVDGDKLRRDSGRCAGVAPTACTSHATWRFWAATSSRVSTRPCCAPARWRRGPTSVSPRPCSGRWTSSPKAAWRPTRSATGPRSGCD